MFDQTTNADIHNRMRRYPATQTISGRVGDDVRRMPRRFNPSIQASPQTAKPIAHPYSRRPSANSFINEFVAVHRNAQPDVELQNIDKTKLTERVYSTQIKTKVSVMQNVASQHRPVRSAVLKRQSVKAPSKRIVNAEELVILDKSKRATTTKNKTQLAMTAMALLIFVVGLLVSFSTWRTNHKVKAQVSAIAQKNNVESSDGTITGSQIPDETKPKGKLTDYRVAADMPRFISIPKLSVMTRVLRLGVADDNELKTPASIYDTGWYDGSSKPGEAGAALIDGHINGLSQPGVFVGLKKLVSGDSIYIERGDGKKIEYKVVKSQSYSSKEVDMNSALTPVVPGKKGLNLITCDGKIVAGKDFTYDRRLIIYAVQVD